MQTASGLLHAKRAGSLSEGFPARAIALFWGSFINRPLFGGL